MSEHDLDRAPDLMAALRASIERFKAARHAPPSLADALAQLSPYADHRLYRAAVNAVELEFDLVGPWAAAARATEIADQFEEVFLRAHFNTDIELAFDCS